MTLGDATWEANHGRLSTADRWGYALAAVGAQLGLLAKALKLGGRANDLSRLDLNRIEYPDTACAKLALEKLEMFTTPAVAWLRGVGIEPRWRQVFDVGSYSSTVPTDTCGRAGCTAVSFEPGGVVAPPMT